METVLGIVGAIEGEVALGCRFDHRQQEDKKVMSLGGTRSSVYSTAWSPKNLWLFCGASYEGKLLFGSVPADEVAVLLDEI